MTLAHKVKSYFGSGDRWTLLWLSVFLLPLSCRLWLIDKFPAVYSWDAFSRLIDPGTLEIWHWLPLPQLPVFFIYKLGGDVRSVLIAYALISSLAAMIWGLFIARHFGRRAGLIAALLTAFLPVYLKYSIMPYQEGAMLLFLGSFLLAADHGLASKNKRLLAVSACCLAAAALCRYEAWLFVLTAGAFYLYRRQYERLWLVLPALSVLVSWLFIGQHIREMPVVGHGLGAYHLIDVFYAALHYGHSITLQFAIDLFYIGAPLAAIGIMSALQKDRVWGGPLIYFTALTVLLALLRAMNMKILNDRMYLIPAFMLAVYAALGLDFMAGRLKYRYRTFGAVLATLSFVFAFAVIGMQKIALTSSEFFPEHRAAGLLKRALNDLPAGNKLGIKPRPMFDVLGNNVYRAIFANDWRLDPLDGRIAVWSDGDAGHRPQADLWLYFDPAQNSYRLSTALPNIEINERTGE